MNKGKIPKHIAFIMDGNGRWAKERGLSRVIGHREGVESVRVILKAGRDLGIKVLTFFAFSTENWDRPKKEVDTLMRYLSHFLDKEIKELHENNVRFMVIGGGDPLPKQLQKKIKDAEKKTEANSGSTMVLAVNYGSRQEIVNAAKNFANDVSSGCARIEDLDVDSFKKYLFTAELPDPDMLIRTSGEMRISNFLLWQLSYAELYFTEKYWPDFRRPELEEAILEFQRRERRYGRIDADQEDA